MGEVVVDGNFPNHERKSKDIREREEIPENVRLLPTDKNVAKTIEQQIKENKEKIIEILNTIINNGIQDYLDTKNKGLVELNSQELEKYRDATQEIWLEMDKISQIVDSTITAVEDNHDEVIVDDGFRLDTIREQLEDYRDSVYELLIKLEQEQKI